MKNINTLYLDALDIMEELNIEVKTIASVTWNSRLRAVWGRCIYNKRTKMYSIELNPILNEDDVSWDAAMNTMIHEVLHAHPDRCCHTGAWKQCAMLINYAYPHYHIERATSAEAKGVADKITYKYVITCTNCGNVNKYRNNSKIVKLVRNHPGSCRCRKCGCTNFIIKEA